MKSFINPLKTFILFWAFFTLHISATSINFKIINKTNNSLVKAETVNLVKLGRGMQVIKSLSNVGPVAQFENLDSNEQGSYMLQAIYQGILYSKVVPPSLKGEVIVDVYSRTHSLKNIKINTIYFLRYFEDTLSVGVFYHVTNETKTTYAEKENGIYAFIPAEAKELAASASVGDGSGSGPSQLNITPFVSKEDKKYYILPQAIKPGGKNYQISYTIPYSGKQLPLTIKSKYVTKGSVLLFIEPDDLKIAIKENAKWEPSFESVPGLGEKKAIRLPNILNKGYTLLIEGGTPLPATQEDINQGAVKVESPLSYTMKFVFTLVSLIMLTIIFIVTSGNYSFLQKFWLKEQTKLKIQLSNIEKLQGNEELKKKKILALSIKLVKLERRLNEKH